MGMKLTSSITYAKQLIKSNYGRSFGWIVEFEGVPIGVLHDYRMEDMFWYSYSVQCSNEAFKTDLFDQDNWDDCRFVFINQVTGDRVTDAFSGKGNDQRVLLRGLHLVPRNRVENLVIKFYELFHYE